MLDNNVKDENGTNAYMEQVSMFMKITKDTCIISCYTHIKKFSTEKANTLILAIVRYTLINYTFH